MAEDRFEGHEGRECGEHRTLGGRAWCRMILQDGRKFATPEDYAAYLGAQLRQGRHDFRYVKDQRDALSRAIKEHAGHHPDDRDDRVDRRLYAALDRAFTQDHKRRTTGSI